MNVCVPLPLINSLYCIIYQGEDTPHTYTGIGMLSSARAYTNT